MNTVSLATTALAQTPSFWHAGADLLRSKSLDRNSYDSGDWFNTLDWTGADNGFGHGLPPKADNEAKWPYMKPLLGNPALKPTAAEVATASAAAADLLQAALLDPAVPAGLGRPDQREADLPGERDDAPGVITMRIDDTVGPDVDPALQGRPGRLQLHRLRRHPAGPGPGRRQPGPVPRPGRGLGPGGEADDLDRVVRHRHGPGPHGRRTDPAAELSPLASVEETGQDLVGLRRLAPVPV